MKEFQSSKGHATFGGRGWGGLLQVFECLRLSKDSEMYLAWNDMLLLWGAAFRESKPLSWGTSASDMLWTRWEYWDLRLHWLIRIGHPCWPAMPLSMKMTKEYRQWTMACETCAFMDDFPLKPAIDRGCWPSHGSGDAQTEKCRGTQRRGCHSRQQWIFVCLVVDG